MPGENGRDMEVSDFEQFWGIYPRRVARKDALKMWERLTPDQKWRALQALPIHVRYWQAANREADRIPHAATWINGERWNDELQMPEITTSNDWMKTQSGIAAKAIELGIAAKAGEGWMELKARILGAMKAA